MTIFFQCKKGPLAVTGRWYLMLLAAGLLWAGTLPCPADSPVVIKRRVTIQPIQVSLPSGVCANPDMRLFEFELDKIWSQAGIDILFLASRVYTNAACFNVSTSPFDANSVYELFEQPGHQQNQDPLVLNMFFVNTISGGAYGFSFQSDNTIHYFKNGMAIGQSTFAYNQGRGRIDTHAHEIGRNLGLDDTDYGAGAAANLMTAGSSRQVPDTVAQVTPHGRSLDQLTPSQIEQTHLSPFSIDLKPGQQYSYTPPEEEPTPPALAIGREAFSVVLSWPASPDYLLQTRPQLLQGGWARAEGSILLTGPTKVLRIPNALAHHFYQLRRP